MDSQLLSPDTSDEHPRICYETRRGILYLAEVEDLLDSGWAEEMRGQVQLLFTSPPFPLNRKKRYGNRLGDDYLGWLTGLAPRLVDLLTPDGSLVMELGNAWEPGKPECPRWAYVLY